MEYLISLTQYFLHIDQHLQTLFSHYGLWTYGILFLIIFCETGLIVMPLLPGDSLLFAAGSLAAIGGLNIHLLFLLLTLAAIVGDTINYSLGAWLGHRLMTCQDSRFFKKSYLDKTQKFYETYGAKAVIIGRFMPIFRTFVPFVAGVGSMRYAQFLFYNVLGALLWVGSLLYASFWFGNLPVIKENFSLVILGIIFISLLAPAISCLRQRKII